MGAIFDFLLSPLYIFIFSFLWTVIVSFPFILLKYLHLGIQTLGTGLVRMLLFGTNGEFSIQNLPTLFLNFSLISLVLWLILLVGMFVRSGFVNIDEKSKSIKTAMSYSVVALVTIWIIPLGIFGLYFLIDMFMSLIFAGDNNNIAVLLFNAVKPENVSADTWNGIADNNFMMDANLYYELGKWPFLITMLIVAILGIGVLIGYFLASVSLLQKMFDQIFLFVVSPFIATTMVMDGGARMKNWKDQMIAKSLCIFGVLIGSRIFAWVIGFASANISSLSGSDNYILNVVLMLIIGLGGALAFVEFGNIIASFVGEGVGLKESAAHTRSLMAGGMAAFGVSKYIGTAGGRFTGTHKNSGRYMGKSKYKSEIQTHMQNGMSKAEAVSMARRTREVNRQEMKSAGFNSFQIYNASRAGGLFNKFGGVKDSVSAAAETNFYRKHENPGMKAKEAKQEYQKRKDEKTDARARYKNSFERMQEMQEQKSRNYNQKNKNYKNNNKNNKKGDK